MNRPLSDWALTVALALDYSRLLAVAMLLTTPTITALENSEEGEIVYFHYNQTVTETVVRFVWKPLTNELFWLL